MDIPELILFLCHSKNHRPKILIIGPQSMESRKPFIAHSTINKDLLNTKPNTIFINDEEKREININIRGFTRSPIYPFISWPNAYVQKNRLPINPIEALSHPKSWISDGITIDKFVLQRYPPAYAHQQSAKTFFCNLVRSSSFWIWINSPFFYLKFFSDKDYIPYSSKK